MASKGIFKNKVSHNIEFLDSARTVGKRRYAVDKFPGLGKAAVILQRDWRNGEDPEKLPFASNIQRHALIRLMHKGLRYYDTEQAVIHKQVRLFSCGLILIQNRLDCLAKHHSETVLPNQLGSSDFIGTGCLRR